MSKKGTFNSKFEEALKCSINLDKKNHLLHFHRKYSEFDNLNLPPFFFFIFLCQNFRRPTLAKQPPNPCPMPSHICKPTNQPKDRTSYVHGPYR